MNSPYPIAHLTEDMRRQLDAERIERSIQMDLEALLERGETERVKKILSEFTERLPRKDAA